MCSAIWATSASPPPNTLRGQTNTAGHDDHCARSSPAGDATPAWPRARVPVCGDRDMWRAGATMEYGALAVGATLALDKSDGLAAKWIKGGAARKYPESNHVLVPSHSGHDQDNKYDVTDH